MRSIMLLARRNLKNFWFFVLVFIAGPSIVLGQQDISITQGNYEVFYSAFNTSFLSADTAKAIGAVRAKDRGMINISIRENTLNGENRAVTASAIMGNTFDLIHKKSLKFQEVVEPGAVYYLAPFSISNNDEFIQISVDITPEGSNKVIPVKFKRKFFLN